MGGMNLYEMTFLIIGGIRHTFDPTELISIKVAESLRQKAPHGMLEMKRTSHKRYGTYPWVSAERFNLMGLDACHVRVSSMWKIPRAGDLVEAREAWKLTELGWVVQFPPRKELWALHRDGIRVVGADHSTLPATSFGNRVVRLWNYEPWRCFIKDAMWGQRSAVLAVANGMKAQHESWNDGVWTSDTRDIHESSNWRIAWPDPADHGKSSPLPARLFAPISPLEPSDLWPAEGSLTEGANATEGRNGGDHDVDESVWMEATDAEILAPAEPARIDCVDNLTAGQALDGLIAGAEFLDRHKTLWTQSDINGEDDVQLIAFVEGAPFRRVSAPVWPKVRKIGFIEIILQESGIVILRDGGNEFAFGSGEDLEAIAHAVREMQEEI